MLEGPDDIDVRRVIPGAAVSGQIIPLSRSQYYNYTFARERDVPDVVKDAIDTIRYPADCEFADKFYIVLYGNYLRVFADDNTTRDFDNTPINFTVLASNLTAEVDLVNLITVDDVNEANEQLVLVLEPDPDIIIDFDEFGGILVLTIRDQNRKKFVAVYIGLFHCS